MLRRMVLAGFITAVILVIHLSGAGQYLTLDNIKKHQTALEHLVKNQYGLSVALYVTAYIVSTAAAIPGALILTLVGGFLFHTFPGVIYVNIGATTGATLSFFICRYIFVDIIQGRYTGYLAKFNSEISENGYLYLLFVRLVPVFPFFMINAVSGLTRISWITFVWTTAIGILPGSIVYTFAGNQIGTIASTKDILSPHVVLAFLLLGLLALTPLAVKKIRAAIRLNHYGLKE